MFKLSLSFVFLSPYASLNIQSSNVTTPSNTGGILIPKIYGILRNIFSKGSILCIGLLLLTSCEQDTIMPAIEGVNLGQNTGAADLTADISQYDNSNLGLYKGTFTSLDASERGTVEVKILDNVLSRATLTLSSGTTYALQSTSVVTSGQDTNLSFVSVAESKESVTFDLSVNADGTNISITNTTLGSKGSHIIAAKETSRAPVVPIAGSFLCTSCGTTNWNGAQTFNLLFISDPSGAGNGTLDTDFVINGTTFSSVGGTGDNNQSGCVPNGLYTDCTISGFTNVNPNAPENMTWTGIHKYDSGSALCSQANGTWAYNSTSLGNLAGTFTSDQQCLPAIGDFRDGGVVFYIAPIPTDLDGDGVLDKGLVCAINDAPPSPLTEQWGCWGDDLPSVPNVVFGPSGLGAEIGDGMGNTNGILNDCSDAPAALYTRSLGPEWFLPSAKELYEMYFNKEVINLTAIANGGAAFKREFYWSSTEFDWIFAWYQDFDGGIQFNFDKVLTPSVRAVRAF